MSRNCEETISDTPQIASEKQEERRLLRRLQIIVAMAQSVLSQDPELTPQKASEIISSCRMAALAMFPGKELAFDLIYRPRLERAFNERFQH